MAITAITPATTAVLAPSDSFAFTIDNTYTTITIAATTQAGTQTIYDSSLGGAQAGFTVQVTDNGDGTDTFSVTRDIGWDENPFTVTVVEDETGSSVTTTFTYYLTSTKSFPQSTNPYYGNYEGSLIVTDDDSTVRQDVGWLDFVGFDVADEGNGKVKVESLGYTQSEVDNLIDAQTTVLWEWNGTDASQFDSPIYVTTAASAPTFTGSIAAGTGVVSSSGNRLEISGTGAPGGTDYGWIIFPINDLTLPDSEFEIVINTDTFAFSANNRSPALALWGDFSTPSAPYCYLTSPTSGQSARLDGNTTSIENNSTSGTVLTGTGMWRCRVEGRITDPDTPRGQVESRFTIIPSSSATYLWRNAYNANDGDLNFSTPATWGGAAAMNQLGLAIQATWSTAFVASTWTINSMVVRSLT